ncbi:MAG: FliG C-terminal domain-containing protein [Pseudomonadota bacterium]
MSASLPSFPQMGAAPLGGTSVVSGPLTQKQKAAVIVRLLIAEGAKLPLDTLPDAMQEALTAEMGAMRRIDRDTLRAVIEEFAGELDSIGLHFPGGIAGALGLLEDHISPATAARLRREAGVAAKGDPWERISGIAPERLVEVLEQESIEVGAVLLAKLETRRAAELLSMLPGDRARALSYALSKTSAVDPDTVRRIGLSLAAQLDAEPVRAFPDGPVQMVGDILNAARSTTRDDVLEGLDAEDAEFAAEVRRAIFTFANIPERIDKRDVPRIVKGLDPALLRTALGYALQDATLKPSADFVLDNMSKRMADALREEIEDADTPNAHDGDAAAAAFIAEVRALAEAGEVLLLAGAD